MVHGIEPGGINGNKQNPDKQNKTKIIITTGSCVIKRSYLSMLWKLICLIEAENNWKINEWML